MRRTVLAMVVALCGRAAATPGPEHLVVSMERTACMGSCPTYKVALFDDGTVVWTGRANVATLGEARGKTTAKKVKALAAAFVKARFSELDDQGRLPKPGGGISMEACTDTSYAILIFRDHTLDDPHCGKANALSKLEKLVDDTAGSKAFLTPAAAASGKIPARLACSEASDCTSSCHLGAVNADWYRSYVKTHPDCKDGCAGKGTGAPRCLKGACVAFGQDGQRDPGCSARPLP